MIVSFNNNDGTMVGVNEQQQQEQRSIDHVPQQAVSSLSSIETTGYIQNDAAAFDTINNNQQSTAPLLSYLMESTTSSSTAITSATTSISASAADGNFGVNTTNNNNGNAYLGVPRNPPPIHHEKQHSAPSSIALAGTGAMQISPSTGVVVTASTPAPNTNTVPEFLYQLTKMLTDDNRDIIEWSNSKIEVHSPHKLESHVLSRYFRHSKFASFQRQLNYFGFRKLAGKGKMAPCSYVNDATTDELGSLLLIKRKQGNEPKAKTGGKKRDRNGKRGEHTTARSGSDYKSSDDAVNPVLAGILYQSSSYSTTASSNVSNTDKVLHGFVPQQKHQTLLKACDSSSNIVTNINVSARSVAPSPVQASLNALTQNFNQSLHEDRTIEANHISISTHHQDVSQYATQPPTASTTATTATATGYVPGSLHRDDSLVDLAMIPLIGDEVTTESNAATSSGFSFVDFPFDVFSNEDPNI